MRPVALLPLFARPMALAVAAVGAAFLLVPLAVIATLMPSPRDPSRIAATAVGLVAVSGALLGFFCGGAISQAARCSFAWTAPQYRRRLMLEFTVAGAAVAVVAGLLTTTALSAGISVLPMTVAAALAAFAAGAALSTVPEGVLLFPILLIGIVARPAISTAWVVQSPGMFTLAAIAVAAASIGAAFSARSFRWVSLVGGPNPLFSGISGRYTSKLDILRTMPWWPAAQRRGVRAAAGGPPRCAYADTVVRRVLASLGSATPSKRFLVVTLGLWAAVYMIVFLRMTGSAGTVGEAWILLPTTALASAARMVNPSRAALPWSRRDHFVVTWVRDFAKLVWFLVATGPLVVALGWAWGWNVWPSAAGAARAIAGLGILFPFAQWATAPPVGGSPGSTAALYLKSLPLTAAFVIVPIWMVRGWPAIAGAAWVQACVLATLLVASQALHWYFLKRYFERRDLVGASE